MSALTRRDDDRLSAKFDGVEHFLSSLSRCLPEDRDAGTLSVPRKTCGLLKMSAGFCIAGRNSARNLNL